MNMRIYPSAARGQVRAPASKSMAHRLLICAGLSEGVSRIHGVAPSQDILATLDCLQALGVRCALDGDTVTVHGIGAAFGSGGDLLCRESGSTLRFLLPLCLLQGTPRTLRGTEKLISRPLSVYETLCAEQGLSFLREAAAVTVCGPLHAGSFTIPGDISSQFVSGLLFALPLLHGDSTLTLLPPVESLSYIRMTISALRSFGIAVEEESETVYRISGNQHYLPQDAAVEGDCSNAAFLEALNLSADDVQVDTHCEGTLQGDAVYRKWIPTLRSGYAQVDLTDCPDLGPVLFAVAAACHGARFTGTRRLRIKESDRVAAMTQELQKFGISSRVEENAVEILPGKLQPPTEVLHGHNDHRIVMALAVLCTLTGGTVDDAQAVQKSYPDFWTQLQGLQVEVEAYGMD